MSALGGLNSSSNLTDVAFLLTEEGKQGAEDVVLASGQTSAISPNSRIPPGTVIVKKAGGKYYLADDAVNGDRNADLVASITSSGHLPNATAAIVLVGNHGTISVTMVTPTGTAANNAADLNANAAFAAHYVASSVAGELAIAARTHGPGEWFYMDATTHTDFGFALGVANAVKGAYADYRVTTYWADLRKLDGDPTDAQVGTLRAGHFSKGALFNLTIEAQVVLESRVSRIE